MAIAPMTAFNTADLRDLVGGWSCLTMVVGFAGAAVSYFLLWEARQTKAPTTTIAKLSARLALAMLLVAFFIGGCVVPASRAYSGPVPGEVRETWAYDKYLAGWIAVAFAAVFAFDAFRFSRSGARSK